jgi:hypothetical protein
VHAQAHSRNTNPKTPRSRRAAAAPLGRSDHLDQIKHDIWLRKARCGLPRADLGLQIPPRPASSLTNILRSGGVDPNLRQRSEELLLEQAAMPVVDVPGFDAHLNLCEQKWSVTALYLF